MSGASMRKIGAYADKELPRQVEQLEQNVATKFNALDKSPAASLYTVPSVATSATRAQFGQLLRVDPASAAFVVLLPPANDPKSDSIRIVNVGSSVNGVTLLPFSSGCTVNAAASYALAGANASVELYPDRVTNNWLAMGGAIGPATETSAGTQSAADKVIEDSIVYATKALVFSTGAGTADATAYTVPATPSGVKRFKLGYVVVRLTTAITGGGTVVIRSGTSAGGNDLLVDSATWTSATAVGTEHGMSIAVLGTGFPASTGYVAELDAAAVVSVRATTAGGGISGGAATISVYGVREVS